MKFAFLIQICKSDILYILIQICKSCKSDICITNTNLLEWHCTTNTILLEWYCMTNTILLEWYLYY